MRTVNTEPEILGHALRDILNAYTREVIVGRGLVSEQQAEILNSDELRREISALILLFVDKWTTCDMDEVILQ